MESKQGSILILTLWVLTFLTMLAIGVGSNVSGQLHLASHFQNRLKMYYLAKAGIERAIVEVEADRTPDYDSLNEKWSNNEKVFKEASLGTGYVTVSYELESESQNVREPGESKVLYGAMTENSRININKAPLQILQSVLENAGGVETEKAADIANAIIDWRDRDVILSPGGAENEYYQELELPYPCKNGDFQVLEELLLVKGMTPQIFSKIAGVITIYGTTGAVNINTAEGRTLRALGLSEGIVRRLVRFRQGKDGIEGTDDDNIFKDVGEIRNIGPLFVSESGEINRLISLKALAVKSDVFRASSTGILKIGGHTFQQNITCVFQKSKDEGVQILYWHEE